MINKKFLIFAIFLVSLLAVSAVSAQDNATGDIASADETTDEVVSIDENQVILKESNDAGTFDDLQKEINNAPANSTLKLNRNYNGAEDKVVKLNKDLTIDGQGHTIDCKGDDCSAFYSDGGTITLKNLKIINGYNDDNYKGGAIYIGDSAKYTIINCTFNNNWADDYGGAIYNGANKLTIIDCSFDKNKADDDHGGAIYSKGDLDIKNSKFTSNKADNNGGAIYGENTVSVDNSLFEYNIADVDGGAIYSKGDVSVKNTTFRKNEALYSSSDSCHGGAIRSESNVKVEHSTFIGNNAYDYGGAIYANTAFISSSSFKENYVNDNDGGAVYIDGSVDIIDSIFEGNHACVDGGAIYSKKDVSVNNTNFTNNKADGAKYYQCYGGAIRSDGNVKVDKSTFIGNHANDYGGAIYANTASISSSSFKENYVEDNDGGAVYVDNSTSDKNIITIKDSIFEGNYACVDGGAIYSKSGVNVLNAIFRNNKAEGASSTQCHGGAIRSKGTVTVYKSTFIGNHAYDYGGAIYAENFVLDYSWALSYFIGNYVEDNDGGAIYVEEYLADLQSGGGIFINNTAKEDGGAIYVNDHGRYIYTIKVFNCYFENNRCGDEGGVIYSDDDFIKNTFKDNVFVDNWAESDGKISYAGGYEELAYNWYGINREDRSWDFYTPNHWRHNDKDEHVIYAKMYIDENVEIGKEAKLTIYFSNGNRPANLIYINPTISAGNGAVLSKEYTFTGSKYVRGITLKAGVTHIIAKVNNQILKLDVNITKKNLNLVATADPIMVGENARIDVRDFDRAKGNVSVFVNHTEWTGEIKHSGDFGWAEIFVPGLKESTVANVIYLGDEIYNSAETSVYITVNHHDLKIDASAEPIYVGDNATVIVTGLENATGNITVTVNNKTYTVPNKDGKAKVIIPGLTNSVTAEVIYEGDDWYSPVSTNVTVTVNKIPTEITLENYTFALKVNDEVPAGATLTPADAGNLTYTSSNEAVVKVKNGTIVAVGEGQANVTVSFAGNVKYAAVSKNITVGVDKRIPVIITSADVTDNRTSIHVNIDGYEGRISMNLFDFPIYLSINSSLTFVQTLKPGSYNVNITALGNHEYHSGSEILTFTVLNPKKLNTTIDLNTDVVENNVTFTVHVNENATGIVKFELAGSENSIYADVNDDGVAVAYCVVDNGNHTIIATYMGDSQFNTNITSKDFEVVGHKKRDTPITAQTSVDENRVTITAEVDLNATGFVEFAVAGKKYYVPVDAGKAVFANNYSTGIYSANITYLGDYNYNPANTTVQFSVIEHNMTLENTSIKINIITGENYAMFTVDINENATGLVEINIDGEQVYLEVKNGQVTYEAIMPGGNYTVTATYIGDSRFNGNSTTQKFTVKDHEKTNTTIKTQTTVDKNTVTLTTNINENATGFVELSISSKKYYIPVEKGKAVLVNDYLPGTYVAKITYLGDDNYNPAKTSTTFTVIEHNKTKKDTPINIDVVCVENNVTITVNIDLNATGLVEINIDGEAVYLPVNNGEVIGEFLMSAGDYNVTATYLGDSQFNGNSTTHEFTVKDHEKTNTPIKTQTTVDKNTVTLTTNVNENATGFVEVSISGKKYYVPVEKGKAVLVNDYLPGTYVAKITYLGDDNYNPAKTSTTFTVIEHNETKKNTPINIDVISIENNVTITVSIDPNATGLVEINIDGEAVYLPVNNGEATEEFLMKAGNHKVTAVYLGDSQFNGNSTTREFTVKDHEKINTTIKTQVTVDGNTVTLTVTTNNGATGFVEFSVAGKRYYVPVEKGKVVLINDYLPGTYVAKITYLGDDNFNPAKTSASFTVIEHNETKKDTSINIDVVCVENNVNITVNVDYNATGLVEINIEGETEYLPVNNGEVIGEYLMDAGNHNVTAIYLGDSKFNSNATSTEFTVKGHEKVNTTIKSQAAVDGNTVTLTTTINNDAAGFVEVNVAGKKYYVPAEKGKAILVNDYLAGTYVADITYLGDDNFNPAKTSTTFTVIEHNETKKNTPINIDVICEENNVTIVVSVDVNATGLVEINIDGEAEYLPINNGKTIVKYYITAGKHKLTATYLGDNKFNANTTSTEFTVKGHEKVNTTIKSQAAVDGNTVTLTTTINNDATGFVEVNVAGKKYYVPVEKGKAILINDYLPGTYVADITYLGDDNFNPAKDTKSFTVIEHNETKKDTPIDIGIIIVNNNVNITVTVDANATGLVEIIINDEAIYLPVNNGAVIGEFILDNGDYNVTTTYLGDNKFNGNTTSTKFTVKDHEKTNTTIKTQTTVKGNTVTLTVTINNSATGFVEVNVAGKKYYIPVEKGKAILVNDYLPGTYIADITYLGDDNYNPAKTSTSFTVIEHNETKKDTPIDIGVDIVGNYVNITVSVDANATGLVEIIINDEAVYLPVNNGAVIGEFILDNGDYNVTATYLGDNKFNGNITSAEFTVNGNEKINTTISASAISIENTAIITIQVNENATGFVKLTIDSTTAYVKVKDGVAIYEAVLPAGTYSFTANYIGDDNFNENTTSGTFTVYGHLKKPSNIDTTLSIDGDIVSIDISVPDATGYVTLDWGENLIYVPLENGSAQFEDEFESGNYDVNIVYYGDDYYLPSDKTVNFTIGKISTKLTASDVTMAYNGGKYLVATLKDSAGNTVSGAKVTIKLGNVIQTLTTDSNGQVSLSLNGVIPDVYTAIISFDGDDVYDKSSTTAKVIITKLQSKVYLRNALYFTLEDKMVKVTLWDSDNKPLAGKTVHITLNEYGLTYSGITDENGTATIRVGVGFGVHSATVSFDGDEIYDASNRTGSIRVIKETPSIMVRGANTHFKASTTPKIVKVYLWDRNSKPLPVNSKVAIKINGQTFVGYTDNQGIASIKINANKPGIFNAQVRYAGNSAYNGVSKSIKFTIS